MKIDCYKYCDGQGAFKNGMHDSANRIKLHDNLYRQGLWNRAMWKLGWIFERATGLAQPIDFEQRARNQALIERVALKYPRLGKL